MSNPKRQRALFRVTYVNRPPFVEINDEFGIRRGYLYDLVQSLRNVLNFTVRFTESDGYGSMFEDADGNVVWDGMVADLIADRADFSAGDLSTTTDRSKYVDFSTSLYWDYGMLYISDAVPQISCTSYLSIFNKNFIATFSGLAIAIFIFSSCSQSHMD